MEVFVSSAQTERRGGYAGSHESDGPVGQGQGPAGSEVVLQRARTLSHTHKHTHYARARARADDGWQRDKADINY